MINRTRKKYRQQRAGAEFSYGNSKKKCSRIWETKNVDSAYTRKPHLKNCKCNSTRNNIFFDTRFFDCNPQKGVSLKHPRKVQKKLEKDFIADVFNLHMKRNPLHPKFDRVILDRLFTKYRALNIDKNVQNFIIEYIQDIMEMKRGFNPGDGPSNHPTLINSGVDGEKYSQFMFKKNNNDQLIDSAYLDKIVLSIEKFKLTLMEFKGYEFKRKSLETSLKKTIEFFTKELEKLKVESAPKITTNSFNNAIYTIAAEVEKQGNTKKADMYVQWAKNEYKDRKEDIFRYASNYSDVKRKAVSYLKNLLDEVDITSNNNKQDYRYYRNNSNTDSIKSKYKNLVKKIRDAIRIDHPEISQMFYEDYREYPPSLSNDDESRRDWYKKRSNTSIRKIVDYYVKSYTSSSSNSNNTEIREKIIRIFKDTFNSSANDLDRAIGKYIGPTDFSSEEKKINYSFYIKGFKKHSDEEFILKVYNKFKKYTNSDDSKRKITEYLTTIREVFMEDE